MTELRVVWNLGDRLRKSLREAGISAHEMAEHLEVDRNTIGNWINGRHEPSSANLRLWAQRTGVRYEWLRYGDQTDAHLADLGRAYEEVVAAARTTLAPVRRMIAAQQEAVAPALELAHIIRVRRQGLEPRTRWLRTFTPIAAAA
jgi:transcriptional regulator with XRE-family HTH domain